MKRYNTKPECVICGAETKKISTNNYRKVCGDKCMAIYRHQLAQRNDWHITLSKPKQ